MAVKTKLTKITEASGVKDRRDLFILMCQTMCLDPEAEAKKLEVKSSPAGLMVNLEHLILFFKNHKLSGGFDFEENTLTVRYPVVQATGKKAIEDPETIKDTSVDESGDETKEEKVIDEGTGPKPGQNLSDIDIDDDDDDDDLPF